MNRLPPLIAALAALAALTLISACAESSPTQGTQDVAATDASTDVAPDVPTNPLAWCDGATSQVYAPLVGAQLELWPDDFYTRDDATSPTGLRLVVDSTNAPWTDDVEDLLKGMLLDLNVLSGFGRNAGAVIRFSAPLGNLPAALPENWRDSLTSEAIQLLDLGTDPPTRVPYEVSTNADGLELILWPLRPLRASTLHAVVVTTDLVAADGGCIAPSQTLRDLLTGASTDPALSRLHERYATLLKATGLAADHISAATVFTTHGDLAVMTAAADDIRARPYAWLAPPTCTDQPTFRQCEGQFEAYDYREVTGYIADAAPTGGAWTLDVTMWLPKDEVGTAPYPTVFFAHGLSGHRQHGASLAHDLAPKGFAVVAVDALKHGSHPTAAGDGDTTALEFMGINIQNVSMEGLVLRGNFNQSLLDRLQVLEVLDDAPDIDGDGSPDIDTDGMGYHGVSLGGMMGSPLLALSERFDAAVLSVAGGRLLAFATDNSQVEPYKLILYNIAGGEHVFVRLLTVAQALVDAADPATYAAHVMRDRLVGAAPDLLMHVAIADEVVPPVTGKALARSLGLPHVGEVLDLVRLVEAGPTLPASGNLAVDQGSVTAGFFQMNRVSSAGLTVPADHHNTTFSPEGQLQTLHFLESWRDTGHAEIIDPYVWLSTPPLVP